MERCSQALIVDNWQSSSVMQNDYRMASLLDEQSYEKMKHDAATEATIYGIPFSGSFSDFTERANELKSRHEEQFSQTEIVSILWSGLSDNALEAYTNCLKAHIGQGLVLGVAQANEHQVTLSLHWVSGYGGPDEIELEWDAPASILPLLPSFANDSKDGIPFVVPRPTSGNHFIAVRGGFDGKVRFGDQVIISAYPALMPPAFPQKEWRFSWRTNTSNSVILQPVPIKMIGRQVRFDLYGRANSRSGGWISAEISVDNRMLYASERVPAHNNPEIRKSVDLEIPVSAKYIKIEFPNGDSTAEYGTANISY